MTLKNTLKRIFMYSPVAGMAFVRKACALEVDLAEFIPAETVSMTSLGPTQQLAAAVIGFVIAAFVTAFIINLFGSGAKAQAGSVTNNPNLKRVGKNGMVEAVGFGILTLLGVGVFVWLIGYL